MNLAARLEQLTKETGARLLLSDPVRGRGGGERRRRSRRAADPRLRRAGAGLEAAMIWYFAYGSNMNPARLVEQRLKERAVQMGPRIGGPARRLAARLQQASRARPPGAGAGNIVRRRARPCMAR